MQSGDAGSVNVSRPSHMTVLRNLRLVDGSGRRNSDSSARWRSRTDRRPRSARIRRSAGMPMPTRISPWSAACCRPRAAPRPSRRRRCGEFEPSLVRKIGSVPPVASKRAWTFSGVIVQPRRLVAGHAGAPLVPRLWKNGLVRSTLPVVLKVAAPARVGKGQHVGKKRLLARAAGQTHEEQQGKRSRQTTMIKLALHDSSPPHSRLRPRYLLGRLPLHWKLTRTYHQNFSWGCVARPRHEGH